jgi:hypothetical protein
VAQLEVIYDGGIRSVGSDDSVVGKTDEPVRISTLILSSFLYKESQTFQPFAGGGHLVKDADI